MKEENILVTGANGQIGQVLIKELHSKYGQNHVLATDINESKTDGPFEFLDILNTERLAKLIRQYNITQIYHLAALLSSKGEKNISLTWRINLDAYLKILDTAVEHKVRKLFFPSTIGIFGSTTPRDNTPQFSSFLPSTVYGISKLTGEMWSQYYFNRFGLDIRSVRYPGVISYQSIPSGGTTDYSVEMFVELLKNGHYDCYLKKDTRLPMVYMPDVVKGTLQLMEVPRSQISISSAYNISSFSLSPEQLFNAIQGHIPEATISYQPDHRQVIAESWSESIDDSLARKDWNWHPEFDMDKMVNDMILNLRGQFSLS